MMKRGDMVLVTYDDLAGVAVGDADDADLARGLKYVGYFVRYKGRGRGRVLVCASTHDHNGDYDGWATWPASVVTSIEPLEKK